MPPLTPNRCTFTPSRLNACPSSRPITPGPKTATEPGRSCQSKMSSFTISRSRASLKIPGMLGAGAGGDDDAIGTDFGMVADFQAVGIQKAGMAHQAMFFRQFLHGADHRRHKLVPLGTYPLHYQPAINSDIASQHTEVAGRFQVVGPLGGGKIGRAHV